MWSCWPSRGHTSSVREGAAQVIPPPPPPYLPQPHPVPYQTAPGRESPSPCTIPCETPRLNGAPARPLALPCFSSITAIVVHCPSCAAWRCLGTCVTAAPHPLVHIVPPASLNVCKLPLLEISSARHASERPAPRSVCLFCKPKHCCPGAVGKEAPRSRLAGSRCQGGRRGSREGG